MKEGYRSVRRDCIDAFGRFFKDVEQNLDNVQVHIDGIFRSDTGKFYDNSKKEKRSKTDCGTRTCIMFGDEGSTVTTYAFHMTDLSKKKNAAARSMRFSPEGGPPVMVVEAELGGDTHGVMPKASQEEKLYRSTSRAANSMSFGPMFKGWLSDNMLYEGSGEEAAVMELANKKTEDGRIDWAAVKKEPEDGDPLKAMAAWGMVADTLDGMADSKDPAVSGAARKMLADTAYHAMGLSGLYNVLSDMDQKMSSDPKYKPDLAAELDPDTPEGREALRGVMCLAAYKLVRDHGGMHNYDTKGTEIIGVLVGDDREMEPVFTRLNFARADAEHRRQTQESLDKAREGIVPVNCTQKLYLSEENELGTDASIRVDSHMQYRFFRCAMLGEDPDMPSGAPRLVMYPRDGVDTESIGVKDVMVSCDQFTQAGPDLDDVSLQDFLSKARKNRSGVYGKVLAAMPAMDKGSAGAGGIDAVAAMAAKRLRGMNGCTKDDPCDAMCLEMELFQAKPAGRHAVPMSAAKGPSGKSAEDLSRQFVANYQSRMRKTRRLNMALDQTIGTPDFSKGTVSFGDLCIADIDDMCYRIKSAGTCGKDNAGKAAESFRRIDCDRIDAAAVTEALTGEKPGNMREIESTLRETGASGAYMAGLEACRKAQESDTVKGSMMLNDFLVLSSCYGIWDKAGLQDLLSDVSAIYDGSSTGTHKGLYRPKDNVENSVLTGIYANGGADKKNAVVPIEYQGNQYGFLKAVWDGAGDNKDMFAKALKKLSDSAADYDTFQNPKYGNLFDLANGPRMSMKAMEAERQAAATIAKDRQHEDHSYDKA